MSMLRIVGAAVLLAGIWCADALCDPVQSIADARLSALSWLQGQMTPNATVPEPEAGREHLVLSYSVPKESPSYRYLAGRSMLYDDALAAIAFTTAGDYRNAALVLNALSRLVRKDGSLWFGYNTHNSWPSEDDSEGAVERSGASAWAGYAMVFYMMTGRSSDPDFLANNRETRAYLKAAGAIADHLLSRMVRDRADLRFGLISGGVGGYSLVYDAGGVVEVPDAVPVSWVSVEHNIDAYFFLKALRLLVGDVRYDAAANEIRDALVRLWSAKDGQFPQGVKVDRVDGVLALDCASWGALFARAIGRLDLERVCLAGIDARYAVEDTTPDGRTVRGYKPYENRPVFEGALPNVYAHYFGSKSQVTWSDLRCVWGEGSLGVALAFLKAGMSDKAASIVAQIARMQVAGGGIRYSTRVIPHEFVDYPSVASTAWFVIAATALADTTTRARFMGVWE